ncbi:MAG TPA: TadE/TadG family type IV pilus assembly protein [Acidimicrobiales bacterium]|nr:TadE/TadG family type IV pilus assembly protein [Acidimicrobiales bacterium]
MSRTRRDDRGAVMVEFAIVLPVLLLILLGIIEFGRAYNAQVSIQAAAREGARELALRHGTADVASATRDAAPSVTIDTVAQTPCPASGDGKAKVKVTESFSFLALPFAPLNLTATGVMRCGL